MKFKTKLTFLLISVGLATGYHQIPSHRRMPSLSESETSPLLAIPKNLKKGDTKKHSELMKLGLHFFGIFGSRVWWRSGNDEVHLYTHWDHTKGCLYFYTF